MIEFKYIPGSSSGRTEDSGSSNGGSNPSPGVLYCKFLEWRWMRTTKDGSPFGSSEERAECEVYLRKELCSLKQNTKARLMRTTQENPSPGVLYCKILE